MTRDREIDVSDLARDSVTGTELLVQAGGVATVPRFRLTAVGGPSSGGDWSSNGARLTIGSHSSNDVALDDPTVSRFHCEVRVDDAGTWLVDLESSNGTMLDGIRIREAALRGGSSICCGRSTLTFSLERERYSIPVSKRTELGHLVGTSFVMRSVFALLERAAQSDATVLLQGETGTGKERAAEAIHTEGARADRPFLVVDCGAIPASLLESELFGHERGAFTGAWTARAGVFEEADGGTVFLDEIGELPLELQPALLRVLENREIRRVGSNTHRKVDVRVVAATNRDLRARVNTEAFRSDLYYRLAVIEVVLPPLRRRPEDVPVLLNRFLDELVPDEPTRKLLSEPGFVAQLERGAWPGNVRELRNFVERCVVLAAPVPLGETTTEGSGFVVDVGTTYSAAKRRVLDEFERRYLTALLERHGGNVSQAARAAGMDRVYVYKLLHRHGLKPSR